MATHRGREKNNWISAITKRKNINVPAETRRIPSVLVFVRHAISFINKQQDNLLMKEDVYF